MYKTITETFPEELIEMLEEEDFEFISEEINNGIATLHFYSPADQECLYDIDISYDRVIIDAKSFLGVLGLGVSRVLTVTYCGKDMDFENTVQKYAVA